MIRITDKCYSNNKIEYIITLTGILNKKDSENIKEQIVELIFNQIKTIHNINIKELRGC